MGGDTLGQQRCPLTSLQSCHQLQPEVTCCSGPAFSGDTGPPPAPLAGEALGAGAE